MQHLLALANTEGTEGHWEGHEEWAWSFEGRWDRGNLCEGEKEQTTGWRCGSMKQRTGSMQTCPCSFSSSRLQFCACFCISPGRGHTRRHLRASHSSHLPLEYKVRDYQSCHTSVKMSHIQKREQEHVSLISYPTSFGYYKSARATLLHVPDVDQHIQLQLLPQEYKVLKFVINRWSVSKLYSYYLIFPTAEIPSWLLASNAFRPTSNISHSNKKSCCIRIAGSQHLKKHPGKKKKASLQSL